MAQTPPYGLRGTEDHPLTDRHLAALLGGADADLLAVIAILALSGMRLAELRRLRVAQCGRGAFRVGECAANLGPREVPIHSALAGTVLRLTKHRVGDALLIGDGGDFGRAPSSMQERFDACRAAVGVVGPSLTIHGLRRWFVGAALEAGQPPEAVAAVIGHPRPRDTGPRPTWGQRCARVEAVHLPRATF
jgi:integrase